MTTRILSLVALCAMLVTVLGCKGIVEQPYRWSAATLDNLDNTGRAPVPAGAGATVPAQALALRLRFTKVYPLSDSSSASTPPVAPDQYTSFNNADTVDAFVIRRLASPGSGAAATDVTADFRVRDRISYHTGLAEFSEPRVYFTTGDKYYGQPDSLDLVLAGNFLPGDSVRFAFTLELSSGTILSDTTDYVTLH